MIERPERQSAAQMAAQAEAIQAAELNRHHRTIGVRRRPLWFFLALIAVLVVFYVRFDVPPYMLVLCFVYVWTAWQLRHCFGA